MNGDLLKVAIVDDDASVRKALCRLLNEMNMDAKSFSSGTDFIQSLSGTAPDCLVLDVRMPRVNGWEILAKLQKMGTDVRTIIVSADDELDFNQFKRSGAFMYLRKPLDVKSLVAAISQMTRDLQPRIGKSTP